MKREQRNLKIGAAAFGAGVLIAMGAITAASWRPCGHHVGAADRPDRQRRHQYVDDAALGAGNL